MFAKIRGAYVSFALLAANSVFLFVIINFTLWMVFQMWDHPGNSSLLVHDFMIADASRVRLFYPDMSMTDYRQLVAEWKFVPLEYDSFDQFQERSCTGRFLNVDAAGFRRIHDQAPWPPPPGSVPVFVFGGSTTFGYPIPDENTIPSYLQTELRKLDGRIAVYNFGRGYYFSSQERALFEKLLLAGHVPAIAIFIDGLNENTVPDGEPFLTAPLKEMVSARNTEASSFHVSGVDFLPLLRLVNGLTYRLRSKAADASANGRAAAQPAPVATAATTVDPKRVQTVDRYLANKRMIEALANAYGATAQFVWQPIATYAFDLSRHPIKECDFNPIMPYGKVYEWMDIKRRAGQVDGHFLWLADIQRDLEIPLYVDRVHYSPVFCKVLAGRIASELSTKRLLSGHR